VNVCLGMYMYVVNIVSMYICSVSVCVHVCSCVYVLLYVVLTSVNT
jgi:hypothetical protein